MSANPIHDQVDKINALLARQDEHARQLAALGGEIADALADLNSMLRRAASQTAPEGVPAWVAAKARAEADAGATPAETTANVTVRACPACGCGRVYRSARQLRCGECGHAWA